MTDSKPTITERFVVWLKYTVAITLIFLVVGFVMDIMINGFTTDVALERLLEMGLTQSMLFAMVVAAFLTWPKG